MFLMGFEITTSVGAMTESTNLISWKLVILKVKKVKLFLDQPVEANSAVRR
jgi:hypothetical protein